MDRLVHTAEAIRDAGPSGIWDQVVGSAKRLVGAESAQERAENGSGYQMLPKENVDTAAARFSATSIEVCIISMYSIQIHFLKHRDRTLRYTFIHLLLRACLQESCPPFLHSTDPTSLRLQRRNLHG
jgi:hypothetical protein